MHSIKSKITLLAVISIFSTILVTTLIATVSVRKVGNDSAKRILTLLCETGEKNLDMNFSSIEQSAKTIAKYAEDDLKNTSFEDFSDHVERVKAVFEKTAEHTAGVLTYYYRIDPYLEKTDEQGFWFIMKADDRHFYEHAPTDLSGYDPDDTSSFVWFTVPKKEGRSIWLAPYITDTLNACVFSYNIPVFKDRQFIGVIGIEIDYNTVANIVKTISLYESGYAFINDKNGNIICHPHYTYEQLKNNHPVVPDGLINSGSRFLSYTFEGVTKQAVWLELNNGMRLNVTVPVTEVSASWRNTMFMIIFIAAVLMVILVTASVLLANHISKPIKKLSEAAEQVDAGNYNVDLTYKGHDEIGTLTKTFSNLVSDLNDYISDLNSIAYKDALTSVHNKGAYDRFTEKLQERIDANEPLEFAIAVFDCDDLKHINDKFGHDKGDLYLKKASETICHVFKHSPVFRTGGDEFTVILEDEDYANLDKNASDFKTKTDAALLPDANEWDCVKVAMGIAVYDPPHDRTVIDVVRRADKIMYEDKRSRKVGRKFYGEA